MSAKKINGAIGHFQEAIRIRPDYAEAHNNLGAALVMQGRTGEAIFHFREAERIKPHGTGARGNLKQFDSFKKK